MSVPELTIAKVWVVLFVLCEWNTVRWHWVSETSVPTRQHVWPCHACLCIYMRVGDCGKFVRFVGMGARYPIAYLLCYEPHGRNQLLVLLTCPGIVVTDGAQ